MRRLAVILVWMAALAAVVVAIGLRVRANRLADPVQTVQAHVREVPPEFAHLATVVGRGKGSVQIEIRATPGWVRTFAERNGFTPITTELIGMKAERWTLVVAEGSGAVLHLVAPSDGPALLTVVE